jgi:hypothetical protein
MECQLVEFNDRHPGRRLDAAVFTDCLVKF